MKLKPRYEHTRSYISLSVVCLILVFILPYTEVVFPHPSQQEATAMTAVLPILLLGVLGAFLWDKVRISTKPQMNQLLSALTIGLGLGALLVGVDVLLHVSSQLAKALDVEAIHVSFPYSLMTYSVGAILVESIYRIIPLSILFWLVGHVILKGKKSNVVFWVLAVMTALIEPLSQMAVFPDQPALLLGLGSLIFGINLWLAYTFKKHGVLAVILGRWGIYLVWHVAVGPWVVY